MIGAHLTFSVPGTPVPKARPRVVLGAGVAKTRAYTPEATARWEKTVATYALRARCALPRGRWPLDVRYRVEVRIYRADGRGDVDNVAKSALDGCNGVLWADDAQVDELHVYRCPVDDDGERLVIEVAPC